MASHASVQFGEETEKPLPAQVLKRDQRRHGGAFAGNIRRAVGAACPPIVRYGTVLRSALTSDTKPYQAKFLSKLFAYLSGTYRMHALTIEQARNSCGLRLPAGSRNADSPGYPRQYDGARARWANCAQ
jgi:hypothetical protein